MLLFLRVNVALILHKFWHKFLDMLKNLSFLNILRNSSFKYCNRRVTKGGEGEVSPALSRKLE